MSRSLLPKLLRRLTVVVVVVIGGFVLSGFLSAHPVLAQANPTLSNFATETGLVDQIDVRTYVIRFIQFLLGFLGLLAVGIVLYGGYLYMTSAGNEQQVELARMVLRNGLIGLAIILLSAAIVGIVMYYFGIGGAGNNGGPGRPPGPCTNCISLGGGIIEDHYPRRGQRDVPRNTRLSISFKEPMLVVEDTVPGDDATDDDTAEAKSFIIDAHKAGGVWTGDLNPAIFVLDKENATVAAPVAMRVATNDQRTFSLYPLDLIGSAEEPIEYKALVKGGSAGLTKATNQAALGAQGYDWLFTTSTIIDTTPPRVVDIYPLDGNLKTPRNAVVQVVFDEAVDPISASGKTTDGFENLSVSGAAAVNGTFTIGAGYKIVEFLSDQRCGVNSCGEDIFCLPAEETMTSVVRAATLASNTAACPPASQPPAGSAATGNPSLACSPAPDGSIYDGVVDMAGNSLDGKPGTPEVVPSGNGTSEGPGADDFTWGFETSPDVIKDGPIIERVAPAPAPQAGSEDVDLAAPFEAEFNRRLSVVRTRNNLSPVKIFENQVEYGPHWHDQTTAGLCSISSAQACSVDQDCPGGTADLCGRTTLSINHLPLAESTDTLEVVYQPRISSAVRDALQNCFWPGVGPVPNSLYPGVTPSDRSSPPWPPSDNFDTY